MKAIKKLYKIKHISAIPWDTRFQILDELLEAGGLARDAQLSSPAFQSYCTVFVCRSTASLEKTAVQRKLALQTCCSVAFTVDYFAHTRIM